VKSGTGAPPEDRSCPAARLDRFEAATGRRQELACGWFEPIHCASWSGISVVHARGGPGELQDGQLASHAVIVSTGRPGILEARVWGEGWRTIPYGPNQVSVVPAGVPYAARRSEAVECVLVAVAPALVASVAGPTRPGVELRPSFMVEDRLLAHVAIALDEQARPGSGGTRLAAESLGTALVAHLVSQYADHRDGPSIRRGPSLSRASLARVTSYVAEHLADDLSLQELAAVAGLDVFAFARAFRESAGLPPHQDVLRARVERAKALLRDPALSVSDVALRVGFATPSHFSTTFRRVTSVTPRSFRRSAG
jgi:AraC family transcriptional regulator